MSKKFLQKLFAVILSAALLVSCLPTFALAEEAATELQLTEGDVIADFVPVGAEVSSSDPAVAWVDENGCLNALRAGTTTLEYGETTYSVTVEDFGDGSGIAGNLKLLARYNDSMQFYDGHVYLLFTSYQDGVEINVPDLYAAYEISDTYYDEIAEDISNGSNHTGSDTDRYFTLNTQSGTMTLDRGEIVTIGMYRDFDLSVPQAALGSLQNSSAWNELSSQSKQAVVAAVLGYLESGEISVDDAIAQIKSVLAEVQADQTMLLDGVVDGGVCFNRELYNQKLEWDQYENVTYELDITNNQLQTLVAYLNGNSGNFSIFKNSCATVALRAWNAAIGTRNGVDTAYKLSAEADGVFEYIDAPKGVRDNIVKRLPGYCLNNADGVAEADAGYQDETGWVYVSAPEKVTPVNYTYVDDSIVIDGSKTKIASLVNAAKAGATVVYDKDEQEIAVTVAQSAEDDIATIDGISFAINGNDYTLGADQCPEDGIWFKVKVDAPAEYEDYYITDADGHALASIYDPEAGEISFLATSLPVSFKIVSGTDGAQNILRTVIKNADVSDNTEIYYRVDGEKIVVDGVVELKSGTTVFVKPDVADDNLNDIVADIIFNGESIFDEDHFDQDENAYYMIMPANYANLTISYEKAVLDATADNSTQVFVGDALTVQDYAVMTIKGDKDVSDQIIWKVISDDNGVLALSEDQKVLTAEKAGTAIVAACAKGNTNIAVPFVIDVLENRDSYVKITFNEKKLSDFTITAGEGEDETIVPHSDYYVKKGSVLTVTPEPTTAKGVLYINLNGSPYVLGNQYTANEDTTVTAAFAGETVSGMPGTIHLDETGATYQLTAQVQYTGLYKLLPVYDDTVRFESSDPLVTVDENGMVTLAGEIPENGTAVYITAYAGSTNDMVSAICKVTVGDYEGDRIVGKLTIAARPVAETQLIAHAVVAFTAYEDTDLSISYHTYYKPNEKYYDLMRDYADHPENYTSDPALYQDNELGIDDRKSYFDPIEAGMYSEPQTITLTKGESITLSNYSMASSNMQAVLNTIAHGKIASSTETQEFLKQLMLYNTGGSYDAEALFDSTMATLGQMITESLTTGHNPADGESEGGLLVNREIWNQFVRSDSITPNHYYTVDITADELTMMEAYTSNPDNNYYSLFDNNCASAVVDIWNTTLYDRPELHLTANYTGLTDEPESIYLNLALLKLKTGLDGEAGDDFIPHAIEFEKAETPTEPVEPTEVIEPTEPTEPVDPDAPAEVQLKPWYYLGDADANGEVTILDATLIQKYKALFLDEKYIDTLAADVNADGVDVTDATFIQRYAAEMETPYPIGSYCNRATGESE